MTRSQRVRAGLERADAGRRLDGGRGPRLEQAADAVELGGGAGHEVALVARGVGRPGAPDPRARPRRGRRRGRRAGRPACAGRRRAPTSSRGRRGRGSSGVTRRRGAVRGAPWHRRRRPRGCRPGAATEVEQPLLERLREGPERVGRLLDPGVERRAAWAGRRGRAGASAGRRRASASSTGRRRGPGASRGPQRPAPGSPRSWHHSRDWASGRPEFSTACPVRHSCHSRGCPAGVVRAGADGDRLTW